VATGILLIGNHPPPFGGVPSHIESLARFLARHDWDVHVLSLVPSGRVSEAIEGYRIHRPTQLGRWRGLARVGASLPILRRSLRFAVGSPRRFLGAVALAGLIDALVRKHAIKVLSAYHLLPPALAASWVARNRRIGLVSTVFGEIFAQPELHRDRLAELRHVVETSRKLLSCSRHCADSFRTIGLDPPVDVIYYGVDTARFSPTVGGEVVRRRLGIAPDATVVLFVGRMIPEMGLDTLLGAVPTVLQRVRQGCVIIAGARGALSRSAESVAAQWPGRVFVQADVPAEELPQYYGAATVVVAPSSNARACLGLAIAEGMASGKAVIASDVGGTREVLNDGETGVLVPPRNPAGLAEAIIRITGDPEARRSMGARGRQVAERRFDADETNHRLERLFQDVLHA
jgi:phosphatidylinositol alpha-1,6-mannosyltransferase